MFKTNHERWHTELCAQYRNWFKVKNKMNFILFDLWTLSPRYFCAWQLLYPDRLSMYLGVSNKYYKVPLEFVLDRNQNILQLLSICLILDIWITGQLRCDQKITVIYKFRELRMFDFSIFSSIMLSLMPVMLTISAILDCQFVFDR